MTRAMSLRTVILALVLSATVVVCGEAGQNDVPVGQVDRVLRGLREGANLRVFGKEFSLTVSESWVNVRKEDVVDAQATFDELLRKLAVEKHSNAVVGGGNLAIELDGMLGKSAGNQTKLVEFLTSLLNSRGRDGKCRDLALRALWDDHFPDSSVFSERARELIH